jgi:hypothetical protein
MGDPSAADASCHAPVESFRSNHRFEAACFPALDKQGFSGNPLDRSILSGQGGTSTPDNIEQLHTTSYIVVCGSKVFGVKTENSMSLVWLPYHVLVKEGLLTGDSTTHLLGSSREGARFALCVKTAFADATISVLKVLHPDIVATDLRRLLLIGSREDAAIAGHAVALTSWHMVRPPKVIRSCDFSNSNHMEQVLHPSSFMHACMELAIVCKATVSYLRAAASHKLKAEQNPVNKSD